MPRGTGRTGKSARSRSKLRSRAPAGRSRITLLAVLFLVGAAAVNLYDPRLVDYYLAGCAIAVVVYVYLRVRKWWTIRRRRHAHADAAPDEFERICGRFLAGQGYTEVHMSGRAYDRGIDIRFKDTDGQLVVAQCKKYRPDRKIGIKEMREFSAAMTDERVGRGIYMTTATYTSDAVGYAASHRIELIDGWQIAQTNVALDTTA